MFILIYKPQGVSSFKCVRDYARQNGIKKFGHTGTLDPLAEGLLLLATNSSTKLIQYVKQTTKTYEVELEFNVQTDTFDTTGRVVQKKLDFVVTKEAFIAALDTFKANYVQQIPPTFSAKKVAGQRAYKLARENRVVSLSPVPIKIFEIQPLLFNFPHASFRVVVSKGGYIRSLVNDLGVYLGTFATMCALKRTMIGNLSIQCLGLALAPSDLFDQPKVEMDLTNFNHVRHGRSIDNFTELSEGKTVLLEFANKIVAVAEVVNNRLQPKQVLEILNHEDLQVPRRN